MRRQEIGTGYGPRDYVELSAVHESAWVVDVGPGRFPLYRANVFIDHDDEMLKDVGRGILMLDDLETGLKKIQDKEFDFVWCSHVLEHVDDPMACAATLSRIGKSGMVVMPGFIKEAIFNFDEPQHRWLVVAHPISGVPIFIRHNEALLMEVRDELVQQAEHYLYREGSTHDYTAEQHLARWFHEKERWLDVVYSWTDRLEVIVIG